ncbi:MAG: FAD-dependent oxidoreductase [Planctomycetota bacterium]|nr:FAD-dependent oxidoreductase [Planctomycetota bacterium]
MREVVLIGGGHAHLVAIRRLGADRPGDVSITLISDGPAAHYSGMLPACVADLYHLDEIGVDLATFARGARISFIPARVEGMDPRENTLSFRDRPPMKYDVASVNIGSVSRGLDTPGARKNAIPTRPLGGFLRRLDEVDQRTPVGGEPVRVVVVGGGAAGVELAFGLDARFRGRGRRATITILERREEVLGDRGAAVVRIVRGLFGDRGIKVVSGSRVARVQSDSLTLATGVEIPYEIMIWATGGGPSPFLERTGLGRDRTGYLQVSRTLQTSSPHVFAAGDCVSLEGHPDLPKAGVYAVRQGSILAENILARLKGGNLREYAPQRGFLSLIMTGDRKAILDWKGVAFHAGWAWRWKDWIDRRWMRKLAQTRSARG